MKSIFFKLNIVLLILFLSVNLTGRMSINNDNFYSDRAGVKGIIPYIERNLTITSKMHSSIFLRIYGVTFLSVTYQNGIYLKGMLFPHNTIENLDLFEKLLQKRSVNHILKKRASKTVNVQFNTDGTTTSVLYRSYSLITSLREDSHFILAIAHPEHIIAFIISFKNKTQLRFSSQILFSLFNNIVPVNVKRNVFHVNKYKGVIPTKMPH